VLYEALETCGLGHFGADKASGATSNARTEPRSGKAYTLVAPAVALVLPSRAALPPAQGLFDPRPARHFGGNGPRHNCEPVHNRLGSAKADGSEFVTRYVLFLKDIILKDIILILATIRLTYEFTC